jgi:ribonuclease P protein component
VLARPNAEGPARLGLAIARKCARRAVDRNRLKRLVRESFRSQGLSLWGLDLVVMCRRDGVAAENAQLLASLASHWARIRKQLCASSSSA